jgi:hypothetical protein
MLLLPRCSPDFTPGEKAFAKLKALLRKAAQPIVDGLWIATGHFVDLLTLTKCQDYFVGAGYDTI